MTLKNIILSSDLEDFRKQFLNKIIVLGTGCFDILHVGHLYFLKEAYSQGDILIVGINSDESIRKIKGFDRPIISQKDRANLLLGFRYVDYVFIYDSIAADEHILSLKPNIFAIGEQSLKEYPSELIAAKAINSRIHVIQRIPSISTTSVIKSILK